MIDFEPPTVSPEPPPVISSVPIPAPPKVTTAAEAADFAIDQSEPQDTRAVLQNSFGMLASLVVHLALLILCALFVVVSKRASSSVLVLDANGADELLALDDVDSVLHLTSAAESPEREAPSADASQVAADSASLDLVPTDHTDLVMLDRGLEPFTALEKANRIEPPNPSEMNGPAGVRKAGAKNVIVEHDAALRQANSPAEAVSGLGGQILRQLEAGDVLVVWMVDASLSMREDRKLAARQMAKIFDELDQRTRGLAYHHKHALLYFGLNSVQLVAPTEQWSRVTQAAAKIPDDASGVENVMTALQRAIPEHRRYWSGALHYVIWTDESGNDAGTVAETIDICKQHQVTVSVVGPTAVMGRFQGTQFFRHDKKHAWWLTVDKGPDAFPLQVVQLPHWFEPRVAHAMPSGFGPFGLVRLSQQTGGSFTNYDRLAERSQFHPERLQTYLPDYGAPETVARDLRENPFRRAVLDAVVVTSRTEISRAPIMRPETRLWFPAEQYQAMFTAIVADDLAHAQRAATMIEEALKILAAPELEEQLKYETSPRWRANYQLARGRLAALSVRYKEYDILATAILKGGVLEATTTAANFEFTARLRSGERGAARRDEAQKWLRLCAREHPQTPWAELANLELRAPFGLELRQRTTRPATILVPGVGGGGGAPAPPRL